MEVGACKIRTRAKIELLVIKLKIVYWFEYLSQIVLYYLQRKDYHKHEKICWAKRSRFQPHWSFRGITFCIAVAKSAYYLVSLKRGACIHRETFVVLLKLSKMWKFSPTKLSLFMVWIWNNWLALFLGYQNPKCHHLLVLDFLQKSNWICCMYWIYRLCYSDEWHCQLLLLHLLYDHRIFPVFWGNNGTIQKLYYVNYVLYFSTMYVH